jgi:hypothetical protein
MVMTESVWMRWMSKVDDDDDCIDDKKSIGGTVKPVEDD